jgi:hypothetical protein
MKTSVLLCVLAAAFASQSLAGCSEIGLVGGKCDQQQVQVSGRCLDTCPEGLNACAGQCVDLEHDEAHCGSCGNACGPQQSCLGGECVNSGTGGNGGANAGGAAGASGAADGGGAAGAAGENPGGSAGQGGEGGVSVPVCEPPFDTPQQCGSCETQCPTNKPVCAQVGSGYQCQPACQPSEELCSGSCSDLDNDPDHCGSCGKVCESGYCFQGQCVGGTFGHVVLMCIDYEETARSSPIQRLLGNSVFLPGARLARILAFDGFTPTALRNNVDLTLTWAAGESGESYRLSYESDPEAIPNRLTIENFDTFLVYAQPDASNGQLAALGAAWKPNLDTFVDDGGTVVVLSSGEMREFISQAGLLDVTAETDVTGGPVFNRAPTDAVGVNVLSPFQARANTCRFTTPELPSATLSYVITAEPPTMALSAPVVVHRTLTRP